MEIAIRLIEQRGALWNLAGLIWLGYPAVWPGEPVITAGFCLLLLGLRFARQPPVTRDPGQSECEP